MDPARMLAGFPAPWTVVEATGEFIVKDTSGRALAAETASAKLSVPANQY
jgi:hypothetical protein